MQVDINTSSCSELEKSALPWLEHLRMFSHVIKRLNKLLKVMLLDERRRRMQYLVTMRPANRRGSVNPFLVYFAVGHHYS